MNSLKKILLPVLLLIILSTAAAVVIINPFGASPLNRYVKNGTLVLPGLNAPVTVHRDEKGMAFIYAGNLDDLWMAQGFVTAQDRLFQMELIRLLASGRISELAGDQMREHDVRSRTLGFRRNAEKHARLLNEKARLFLQKYVDGVNAFIQTRPQDVHLEFRMTGLQAEQWDIVDSLTILYFMGWNSAANLKSEVIAQMLIEKLGPDKAAEIFPLNINPDDAAGPGAVQARTVANAARIGLKQDGSLQMYLEEGLLRVGSNNWVAGAAKSTGGKPVLANDPHLEANILPGPLYPCGLITPRQRAVGATIPGIGGMTIGRTEHIAVGVTNAYSDTQDLYIETVDPRNADNYLEGETSVPFEVIEETLKVRDRAAPDGFREESIKIRLTRRGPVISGVMAGFDTDKVITARWSGFEVMTPGLGLEQLLECRNADELRATLKNVNHIAMNFVLADSHGNFGWQTTGKIPIRKQGIGLVPHEVKDGQDNWIGWIPWSEMPHAVNPARGWVGTCNHMTVGTDYPYHYTSFAAPSFRYRRLVELMDAPGKKSAEDHWGYQLDAMNLLARQIAPEIARVLTAHEDTRKMGRILSDWNFVDSPDQPGPTVFQAIFREFAQLVYSDELGDELAKMMLRNWSFWQERLLLMLLAGDSPWFDIVGTTAIRETRDDLFYMAALRAAESMSPILGDDPAGWLWGKAHVQEFLSPIRRVGIGKNWLGGGSHPARGSEETLCRGIYDFGAPYQVAISASLRMVADLADPDKIMAVLPGGITGRQFDPHTTDQIAPFMNGDKMYWWFSDKAIEVHTKNSLTLNPQKN
jgi:penicillin amidase